MKFFADSIVKPYLAENHYREICEIGASLGENTDRLLEVESVGMTLVDPCIDAHLVEKYSGNPRVRIERGISLDVLPSLSKAFDCILLDGDHNWYTVYNELRIIREKGLLKDGGSLIFHDVGWPYDRRDLYYDPDQIPPEYRHSYARKGIVYGQSPLSETSGSNGHLYNALHEGGPRNGVLTAVEDFLKENGRQYAFFRIDQESGLGVMLKVGGDDEHWKVFKKYRSKARFISWVEGLKNLLKPSRRSG